MKKTVIFIGSLEEGGAERVVSLLSAYFAGSGRACELLLYHDKDIFYKIDDAVTVRSVKRETSGGGIIKNILWMRSYLKANADAVISFLAPFNMVAVVTLFASGVPLIVADRNDPSAVPKNSILRIARNLLYRFADRVVLQTEKNRSYFGKCVRKKSDVIYNPIDMGEKKGIAMLTEKQDVIVSVGRLMKQKNQEMLIRAFAELHKTGNYGDLSLIIYGSGPYRRRLEDIISELGMNNNIFLPGSEKNIFDKIACARMFVLSSDYEGMPNALAEAMCLGLPCVSTKVSGAVDLITDGQNGLLVDIGDVKALKNAMEKILSDGEFGSMLAKNAVALNDTLNSERVFDEWQKCLGRVQNK